MVPLLFLKLLKSKKGTETRDWVFLQNFGEEFEYRQFYREKCCYENIAFLVMRQYLGLLNVEKFANQIVVDLELKVYLIC